MRFLFGWAGCSLLAPAGFWIKPGAWNAGAFVLILMGSTLIIPASPTIGAMERPFEQKTEKVRLRLLPEHPRYFEYKGLPMALFGHQGGAPPAPVANHSGHEAIVRASRYGNHFFMAIQPGWVRATYEEIYQMLQDERHWQTLGELAQTAYEHDVILHLFFWSYKFNIEKQDWTGSDMIWPDPAEDGGIVIQSAGLTRRDLHILAIKRCLEATWRRPNVVYNFMWEYNVRYRGGQDPEGAFHRWWVERLKEEGRQLDPEMEPLISIKLGLVHPSETSADFVVEEDGNGFWFGHSHQRVLDFNVPAVFISSDFPFADNDFRGWETVPYQPRVWTKGQVRDYPISPGDLRAMASEGFHPAETWVPAREDTLRYYLQARWYLENLGVLDLTLDGAIKAVPAYTPSERPRLVNPENYTQGRNGAAYGVLYSHPEGLGPAQAEVWIDVDGDGRFSPDPSQGERFTMESQGHDYKNGVLFTTTGPAKGRYVFRFADRNWNPPVTGGLVPGMVEGISYSHWGDNLQ
jgi:hypothetical protein